MHPRASERPVKEICPLPESDKELGGSATENGDSCIMCYRVDVSLGKALMLGRTEDKGEADDR